MNNSVWPSLAIFSNSSMLGSSETFVETEAHQEFLGRLVENRTADDLFASAGSDEFAVEQRADDAGRFDTADLADLRDGDGLFVRDDGEGFQGRERERTGGFRLLAKARTTS